MDAFYKIIIMIFLFLAFVSWYTDCYSRKPTVGEVSAILMNEMDNLAK